MAEIRSNTMIKNVEDEIVSSISKKNDENIVLFIHKIKLGRLKDNYRVGFGIFKDRLSKDAIKRLVAEINMSVFNTVTTQNAEIVYSDENVSLNLFIKLTKSDEVTIIVPVKIIDTETFEIDWDNAIIIPYVRAKEMRLSKPKESDVAEQLRRDEKEGIDESLKDETES